MAIGSLGLALLAGMLSTLSPCVLPILPIVLGGAASEHRFGPVALAGGLAVSFAAIGLFVATVGFSIGLDTDVFRYVAAALLVAIGAVLLIPPFQAQFAVAAGPVSNWAGQRFGGFSTGGLGGQFALGLLLGAVWSPCVGPTLGAASVLAAQGRHLAEVAVTMAIFGIGAAMPLLVLGFLSRDALIKWRDRLGSASKGVKRALGLFLVLAGILILSGLDKRAETILVQASPPWLTELTTRF
jgi:cytochrome c biogenesis protein CcdA